MKPTITCLIQSSCFIFSASVLAIPCMAQVASDGTTSTTVTSPDGNNFTINEGNRAGDNLFHSFQDFSVPTNGSAFFNNAVDIANIFSRVTGGNISNIDGLIRANGSANLFLINPAGIIFGQNARLDIGGSFLGSTADSLLFEDGTEFIATDGQNKPIITINAPIGLSFRDNPGDITVGNSNLQVDEGKTLALIGKNLILDRSNLEVGQGRIELGSVAGNEAINLTQTSQGLIFEYGEVPQSGEIRLTERAKVTTSGKGGGAISIRGSKITLTNESTIIADTLGTQNGKGIEINTNQLIIKDGSQISASAVEESKGNSGGIKINAVESVELIGSSAPKPGSNNNKGQDNNSAQENNPSKLSNDSRGKGQAGDLIIETKRLLVMDGARISSSTINSSGGGNIRITASESVEVSGIISGRQRPGGLSVQTRGKGQAGDIFVNTKKLIVKDGAEISASTFGQGDGGNINLTAVESLEATGISESDLPTSIIAETGKARNNRRGGRVFGTGNGGNLNILTGKLIVRDGARIDVSSNESNVGSAGNLEIKANSIDLNQGILDAETAVKEGGNIELTIANNLSLRNNSTITAKAVNNANGGNVNINAKFIVSSPQQNNDIIASAEQGRGGNIKITSEGIFGLEERSSTPANSTNDIDASSQFGLDGNVTINAPDVGSLQETIETPVIVELQTLGINACAGGGTGKSNFNITGKGGVPPQLISPLGSDAIVVDGKSIPISTREKEKLTPLVTTKGVIYPARGIVFLDNGDIVLTDYPTQNIQRTPSSSPNCRKS